MTCAMGAFRAVGFKVGARPVRDTRKLAKDAAPMAKHEVLGLVYYRLRGRVAAFMSSAGA